MIPAAFTKVLTHWCWTNAVQPAPPPVPLVAIFRYEVASDGVTYSVMWLTQPLAESRKLAVRSAVNHATAAPCGVPVVAVLITVGPGLPAFVGSAAERVVTGAAALLTSGVIGDALCATVASADGAGSDAATVVTGTDGAPDVLGVDVQLVSGNEETTTSNPTVSHLVRVPVMSHQLGAPRR